MTLQFPPNPMIKSFKNEVLNSLLPPCTSLSKIIMPYTYINFYSGFNLIDDSMDKCNQRKTEQLCFKPKVIHSDYIMGVLG